MQFVKKNKYKLMFNDYKINMYVFFPILYVIKIALRKHRYVEKKNDRKMNFPPTMWLSSYMRNEREKKGA